MKFYKKSILLFYVIFALNNKQIHVPVKLTLVFFNISAVNTYRPSGSSFEIVQLLTHHCPEQKDLIDY